LRMSRNPQNQQSECRVREEKGVLVRSPKHAQGDPLKHFAKDDSETRLKALRILTQPQRVRAWAALVLAIVGSVALAIARLNIWG
jgi:hypothetical protein